MNTMNTLEAMQARHSVRQFEDRPIEESILSSLKNEIDACNKEGHLHIQLVTNEPEAFSGTMAHYGKFSGVRNSWLTFVKKRNFILLISSFFATSFSIC